MLSAAGIYTPKAGPAPALGMLPNSWALQTSRGRSGDALAWPAPRMANQDIEMIYDLLGMAIALSKSGLPRRLELP
jgi:hypothetical protein